MNLNPKGEIIHNKVSWVSHLYLMASLTGEDNHSDLLEGPMLKLKLHYSDHLMWRADSLEKTLMLGKIEGRSRRGWQRMRCLDRITDSMDMNLSRPRDIVKVRSAWCATVHGVTKSQTQLRDWTTDSEAMASVHFSGQWSPRGVHARTEWAWLWRKNYQ